MILQALNDYYARSSLAPQGWELRSIPYFIIIDEDGAFVRLVAQGDPENPKGIPLLVPQAEIRSGKNAWAQPNLLWDHYGFVLGEPKRKPNGDIDPTDSYEKSVRQMHSFVARINALHAQFPDSKGLSALSQFYRCDHYKSVLQAAEIGDLLKNPGTNITFKLNGTIEPIFHEDWVSRYIGSTESEGDEDGGLIEMEATCLVSGELTPIARLHPKIYGVCSKPTPFAAANTKEAQAYSSYGKEQGFIFPVGKKSAFSYSTALNHLLRKGSSQKIQVGDGVAVFWTEQASELETVVPNIFGEPTKDDPDANTRAVRALYEAVQSGKLAPSSDENRFHVLGLAPNAARISVRFYHCLPLSALAARIVQHFDDLKLVRGKNDAEFPSLFRLLTAVAVQNKADNIPPNLGGAIVDAIFAGPDVPYPSLWLNAAVNRSRVLKLDDKFFQSSLRLCTAVIKACLNRNIRRGSSSEKEFLPMLDHDNKHPAYRLGRLFAVLERLQEESAGGVGRLNATIRDRYYGAASSSPATVFPVLLKLKNHHVSKLDDKARRILYRAFEDHRPDDYIGTITQHVSDIPAHLPLQDQGRFALGYYHQRQAFFTKSDDKQTTTEEQQAWA